MKSWCLRFERPVPYSEARDIQLRLLEERRRERIPDTVLLLQHPPTITLGQRGRDHYLLKTPAEYRERGIEVHKAERGGDVTWHGPGQWVLYPILHLGGRGADSHGYLYNLEEVAVRTAGDLGVRAWRREGKNGAWTEAGKIAAIGFRLRRWVTFHGMSFNVMPDLSGFDTIVPCGLEGEKVASIETLLGSATPSMDRAGDALLENFEGVFDRTLTRFREGDALPAGLQPDRGT
ncbi:lipoyl(octanoyl) transferase LipB [Kiritimatiella glycovorans]|uniref:Octanoyltransferase n=1 Tax=Kiritimatiella glycovorans TaxID=1307763 RepID=A0A0G3ED52_9BACT|nr:lipoyl(octanoyl) transferase LipB [Kiritimatiella glycovorans]AKJ64401.1 Octanoyltransferase [Kiritimatiella glycovorans]